MRPQAGRTPSPVDLPETEPVTRAGVTVSEDERRRATVLFSDLSGYTTMPSWQKKCEKALKDLKRSGGASV